MIFKAASIPRFIIFYFLFHEQGNQGEEQSLGDDGAELTRHIGAGGARRKFCPTMVEPMMPIEAASCGS